jgi:DNA-binding transcriptional LysR family regulator
MNFMVFSGLKRSQSTVTALSLGEGPGTRRPQLHADQSFALGSAPPITIASMESLRGILNFARTAELGSFAAAARELGITAVAVSQNISRLEASLGVRLLARSTRALSLTAEGEAFLAQCKGPLAALDSACQSAREDASVAGGLVRASVVSPLAFLYLVPLLGKFYSRYPGVRLELELSEDSTPLINKRFDVGIRVGAMQDASFVARPLGPLRLPLCASPTYLAAHGIPEGVAALQSDDHQLLALHISGQEQPAPFLLQSRSEGARSLQMQPTANKARLACSDFRSLLQAACDGLGIAQLPQPLALPALRDGRLRCILLENAPEGWQLFIHYPSRRQLPARVRAFVDFCIEHLGGHADLIADLAPYAAQASTSAQRHTLKP